MMMERGNPLSGASQGPRRPVPRRSEHVLFMKKLFNMIERGHPLFAVTQVTRKVPPKHVHLMTERASVKSISPIQENSMQYGYDENDNKNMSDETKCETNYSINNKWNNMRKQALHQARHQ